MKNDLAITKPNQIEENQYPVISLSSLQTIQQFFILKRKVILMRKVILTIVMMNMIMIVMAALNTGALVLIGVLIVKLRPKRTIHKKVIKVCVF